jgi:3-hydroxyacyl-[acyl-carrier-protein] dehydratase
MESDRQYKTLIDNVEITKILPHRYPFLLVDKVVFLNLDDNEIIAQKNVTCNEQFFQGHFPNAPIMPGVLVIEALAQTGGVLVHKKTNTKKIALLLNVKEARFRHPIKPGDVIDLYAKGLHISNKGGKIQATASVEKKICVEAMLSFALVEKNQL